MAEQEMDCDQGEKLGSDSDEESPKDLKQTKHQEARKQSIERCIQSLVHACGCQDQQCREQSCMKMKRVVAHTKVCKRKTNGGCPICKQLIALCCYHGKLCNEVKCLVPFCPNIKHKLKQLQLAHRIQQAELIRRRVGSIITENASTIPPSSSSSVSDSSTTNLKWRESISDESRKHIARMYSQAINPDENENIGEIIEDEIYKKADSKKQYYHLLAENIYTIQKEAEEKRQKRKEQEARMAENQTGTTTTTAIAPKQSNPMQSGIQPNQQQLIQTNSQEINTTFDASDRLISYVENNENADTSNQPNESSQVEVMGIIDLLSENDQQDSWVVVKSETPDAITSDQIISHRKNCNDFNCPACLPLNLAIRELKTSKQNIDNILSLLEMECDDSD